MTKIKTRGKRKSPARLAAVPWTPGISLLTLVCGALRLPIPYVPTALPIVALVRHQRMGQVSVKYRRITHFVAWTCTAWAIVLFQAKARSDTSLVHAAAVSILLPSLIWGACHAFLYLPDRKSLIGATTAAMFSLILGSLVFRTSEFAVDPWKYALGMPVTIILVCGVLAVARRAGGRTLIVMGLLLGMLNVILGFRSLGLIATVALVGTGVMLAQTSPFRRWMVTLLLATTVLAGFTIYGDLASAGNLGNQQQTKWAFESQTEGGAILGARPEFIASMYAIRENPWLGHGGSPVSQDELVGTLTAMSELNVSMNAAQTERILGHGVNSHSMALQSWVDGGVLGIVPWVGLLVIVWRGWARALVRRDVVSACVGGLLSVQLTWDFLFSPWSPGYEIVIGLAFGIAVSQIARTAEVL